MTRGIRTPQIEIDHFAHLRSSSEDVQLAWVAGFLEGEGSFVLNRDRPRMRACQVDLQCLELLQFLFGGSIQTDKKLRSPRSQPLHEWVLDGVRARDLMTQLHPFMSDRRKDQITHALSGRRGWRGNGAS